MNHTQVEDDAAPLLEYAATHDTTESPPSDDSRYDSNNSVTEVSGYNHFAEKRARVWTGVEDEGVPAEAAFPMRALAYIYFSFVLQSMAQSGAQAVLAEYTHEFLGFPTHTATLWVNLFMAIYNLFGPVGAMLSDYGPGNYKTQVWSYVIWTVGAIVMVLTAVPAWVQLGNGNYTNVLRLTPAFVGLFLTAVGYGIINPIQSVFVADQFVTGQEVQMAQSFSWFYFYCNVGNIAGEFGGPMLRHYVSYFSVLLAVAIAQTSGTGAFLAGRQHYRKVPPKKLEWQRVPASTCCETVSTTALSLSNIFRVFAPLPVFWALLYQQSSTWIFQGAKCDRTIFGGAVYIPPDIMPSLDDVLCCVLIPVMDWGVYPLYERVIGRPLKILHRMVCGMVSVAIAFVLTGFLELYIDSQPKNSVSIGWQIPQYVFVSLGEIMVAIPGLEFAYGQAPDSMKNVVTAMWCLTQAVGSLIIGMIAQIPALNAAQAQTFFGYSGAMLFFVVVFVVLTWNFRYKRSVAVIY